MTDTTTPGAARSINAGPRTIRAIAADIELLWGEAAGVWPARPYLSAMASLDTIADTYGSDDGESIVRYFLSNAAAFRGPQARQLKEELRALLPKPRR
jgi:hypothetical protein